ncbi:MAG: DEAD/DEAH box helicase [archaeon]|nr:DEAD/DEAH box helicase [archaeon]
MKFRELPIPESLADELEAQGFDEMYPPQQEALPRALDGDSLLVTTQYGSGKSIIGYVSSITAVLENRGRVLYLTSDNEKAGRAFKDLCEFGHLGLDILITTGAANRDAEIDDNDIIVTNYQHADMIVRGQAGWQENVTLVVADDMHLVKESGHGISIRSVMNHVLAWSPSPQIIALSDLLTDYQEIEDWLFTYTVRSEWRPRFSDLKTSDAIRDALKAQGFREMHPPQARAIPLALEGRNLVVAVPTASGKTMIAVVPALYTVLVRKRKALYIVPLKALASEKRDDFKKYEHLGLKVVMTSGDPDRDDDISDADIVIATSEKTDSMIRHGNRWLDGLGLLIADEVHMIHDPLRGPTLEVAMTKLIRRNSDLQVIALSATISNSLDLAHWLKAEHVKMLWRPTRLKEGAYLRDKVDNKGVIRFGDGTDLDVPLADAAKDVVDMWSMIKQTVEAGGQCLVFVNARRSTESVAYDLRKKMKALVGGGISDADRIMLEGGTEESTSVGKKLAECVDCGIAFHHAGLEYNQRRSVEEGFRNRSIKCIVATPTLAAGINLPARRVIVRDTTRFESNAGNVPIPNMEIQQMCGRAGRPGYDPWREAVLMAKSYENMEAMMENYILADTERLTSKLGDERLLRSHLLGLIATGDATTEAEMVEFMGRTFYGATCELYGVDSVIGRVVDFLAEQGMVQRVGETISILPFGKRISDLYIDPWSAVILKKAVLRMDERTDELQIMHAVACTPDVLGLYAKKADQPELEGIDAEYEGKFLCTIEDECGGEGSYDMDYDNHMADLKTALLLTRWVDEMSEEKIVELMNIGPGDIRSRVDTADWILYAMNEVALLFNPDATSRIKPMLTRIRYGVREELIPLVSFRGVGRTRARTLFDKGVKGRQDISRIDLDILAGMPKIGMKLASSLKEQAGYVPKVIEQEPPRDDMDEEMAFMLERMAAEEEARNNPRPPAEQKPSKTRKPASNDPTPPNKKQATLFDF